MARWRPAICRCGSRVVRRATAMPPCKDQGARSCCSCITYHTPPLSPWIRSPPLPLSYRIPPPPPLPLASPSPSTSLSPLSTSPHRVSLPSSSSCHFASPFLRLPHRFSVPYPPPSSDSPFLLLSFPSPSLPLRISPPPPLHFASPSPSLPPTP
ncbi:uncharacterized protein SCHCODRAFT_02329249 [Schizophyllum commune H4-8]|uniref:uncharacterized protein n=1 Tax=Schizophyllum commune (strain H4-8 / FGSC 9210) TaxID=578458 RepID=UPI00215F597B|nr:uncharacterized protein SCHCODRAFT_02329249 [Schizophyllum commune H4-8]KAI5891802.1 hypothetical protein SCHCODRAFT_02329249 [Schizophyllum commune H4-8]